MRIVYIINNFSPAKKTTEEINEYNKTLNSFLKLYIYIYIYIYICIYRVSHIIGTGYISNLATDRKTVKIK